MGKERSDGYLTAADGLGGYVKMEDDGGTIERGSWGDNARGDWEDVAVDDGGIMEMRT